MVRDQIALVNALGYRSIAMMMVGHDQGSLLAALGALIRPDMFPRLTLVGGAPLFPFNTANGAPATHPEFTNAELDAECAKLNPPRKGY
jgi:pimeloyl-ACP methyl ester carboxylesterase